MNFTILRLPYWSAFASALVGAGCATTGGAHDHVAVVGRVVETFPVGSDMSWPTPGDPGMAAAAAGTPAGPALVMLAKYAMAEPDHTLYVVLDDAGKKRFARSRERIDIGTCVAFKTNKARADQESWLYGLATVVPAVECK